MLGGVYKRDESDFAGRAVDLAITADLLGDDLASYEGHPAYDRMKLAVIADALSLLAEEMMDLASDIGNAPFRKAVAEG